MRKSHVVGAIGTMLAACGIAVVLSAQVSPTQAFEVASIKRMKITGSSYTLVTPGGRFTAVNFSLHGLILRAYRVGCRN